MKHVLGNLLTDTYDDIRENEVMKQIFAGTAGDQSVDLLCRKCLFAMVEK